MLAKQIDVARRSSVRPLPISYIIRIAQQCSCDVYIQSMGLRINAKDYNQMKRDWKPQSDRLVFFFNGADEVAAGDRLQKALEN
ncbi:MAG: HPr family phosphocarrier protein [Lachnospiraceae bacterium]|nr:HPr family phosphocarrier protein [Lachnospiraceae bacterium]